MNSLKKNDYTELEITAISSQGMGVGRVDGMVVFVPTTAIGDVINAKIVKVEKSHCFGIVSEIITPSPARIENDCPHYPKCGGCSLRHINYAEELGVKENMVLQNLARIGKVEPVMEGIIPSPIVDRYRNKVQYPLGVIEGKPVVGFYAKNSHRLIPVTDCLLQPALFTKICRVFEEFLDEYNISVYDERVDKGLVRHLVIRGSADLSQVIVTVVINGQSLPFYQDFLGTLKANDINIKSLTLSHNTKATNVIMGRKETILAGSGAITDSLAGVNLSISATSFYQVNHGATEILYSKVAEFSEPTKDDVLLDLYCGIGSIGLSMADKVGCVIGVELYDVAVKNARANRASNSITNATFFAADAASIKGVLGKAKINPTIIVVDPPRKGLGKETVTAVASLGAAKIVYVSCDSATLARDLGQFWELGYTSVKGCVVDMFPRTTHVETVVLLTNA